MLLRRLFLSLICVIVVLPNTALFADDAAVTVEVALRQCSDGIDNDGDALVDYPDDSGCDSPNDDSEIDITTPTAPNDNTGPSSAYRRGVGAQSQVVFYGTAQPHTWVFAFEGDVMIAMVRTDASGVFLLGPALFPSSHRIFTFYAFNPATGITTTHTFSLSIPRHALVTVSDIMLAVAAPATTTTSPPVLFLDNIDVVATTVIDAEVPSQQMHTDTVHTEPSPSVAFDAASLRSFMELLHARGRALYANFLQCPTPYTIRVGLASVQFLQPITPLVSCTVLWFSDPFSERVFDGIVGVYDSIRRR